MHKPFPIDFRNAESLEDLAKYINVQPSLLEQVVNSENQNKRLYSKIKIPKRGKLFKGDYRIAWVVKNESLSNGYKSFTRRFSTFMQHINNNFPHKHSYGYIAGKNIFDNAINHCGAPFIMRADISNFFPTISIERLIREFIKLGIKDTASNLLARFVTIEGSLPLGLPSSPLLANVVCFDLDEKLTHLASLYQCNYTRYADDISLSGIKLPPKEQLAVVLKSEGFLLSERKYRITKRGQAHYVTGLSVTDSDIPHVPRAYKRKLRQELYYCKKYGILNHLNRIHNLSQKGINRIDGMVHFVGSIEKESLPTIREDWRSLLKSQQLTTSFEPRKEKTHRKISFYIDETEINLDEKKLFGVAFVETDGTQDSSNSLIFQLLLRDYIVDPFTAGHKKVLEKKNLHYTDCPPDLRQKVISILAEMHFKSYVILKDLDAVDNYEKRYINLLEQILPHRLMGCDEASVSIYYEENSKLKHSNIVKTVGKIYNDLAIENNRRPLQKPIVIREKKSNLLLTIPDYILGILKDYIKSSMVENNATYEIRQFEMMRDKYKIIKDADKNEYYTRKRPFYGLSDLNS